MRWIRIMTFAAMMFAATAANAVGPDPLAPLAILDNHPLVIVTAASTVQAFPHIVGTVALVAGMTSYDVRWRRVSAADLSDPRIAAIASAAIASGTDPVVRLHSVQKDITRRIRFRPDLDTYHVADYWAPAGETLTRGEGDGEDIAILKMQALKAAGFPARDLYLSVGRDRVRGADAMLLVRVRDRFFLLDDRSPVPLSSAASDRFEPVITLGQNKAWIHGRRIARQPKSKDVHRASLTLAATR